MLLSSKYTDIRYILSPASYLLLTSSSSASFQSPLYLLCLTVSLIRILPIYPQNLPVWILFSQIRFHLMWQKCDLLSSEVIAFQECVNNCRCNIPPDWELKCSQFPSCVDFTGFNCIQNCVYCYYLSFFSKIALKHRPHYFHI